MLSLSSYGLCEPKFSSEDKEQWSAEQRKDYDALEEYLGNVAEYYFEFYKREKDLYLGLSPTSELSESALKRYLSDKKVINNYLTVLVELTMSFRKKYGFFKEDNDLNRIFVDIMSRGDDHIELMLLPYYDAKKVQRIKELGPSLAKQVLREEFEEN